MIKAAEKDEWAGEDDEREYKMCSFVKAVKSFDGTSVSINSKGLFEIIQDNSNENNVSSDTIKKLILANVEEDRQDNVNKLLDQLIDIVSKQEYRA